MTVSIESAMMSRDWREKDMPSVPMLMPSDTPIVLKLLVFGWLVVVVVALRVCW